MKQFIKDNFKILLFPISAALALLAIAVFFVFSEQRTDEDGQKVLSEKKEKVLPFSTDRSQEIKAGTEIFNYFTNTEGQDRSVLILLQNNLELRPGGGLLSSYAVVKIKEGELVSFEVNDLADSTYNSTLENPPYPLAETMGAKQWNFYDSNFSPDFKTNAEQAELFYYQKNPNEKIDAVIGVTGNIFPTVLSLVGPITVDGYPGEFNEDNALYNLEYQVEKAFEEQGIERSDRKNIIGDLARKISQESAELTISKKIELGNLIISALNKKDIQLYFKNEKVQEAVAKAGWDGDLKELWKKDYLMMVDANMGSLKSDYFIDREIEYSVDLSGEEPTAKLSIMYDHGAQEKSWMTKDYLTYLRVYIPRDSWFVSWEGFSDAVFGEEFGKMYLGALVNVSVDSVKVVEIEYRLPENLEKEQYDLLIQKQAGVMNVPTDINIKYPDGTEKSYSYRMNSDFLLSYFID